MSSSPEELELSEKRKVEEAVRLLCSVTGSGVSGDTGNTGDTAATGAATPFPTRPGPSGLRDEGDV